ncbi:GNAT family N-acetyltransferase [Aquirufa aurantiipilula]|uniref:GNAT family N-acetyltransferase n=1 Tax=Aquirufa aurantiipilula TaxID=2696561 RepID=UPI001CAA5708|nr:GNAT family N-acetyltransferase [Aquirufa aurantiipilula]MBZ1326678.1 GNAT family N-acetyltransferase [Aquirufa aurantiipilula]
MQIQEIPIQQVLLIRQQVMWPDKDLDFVKVPGDDVAIHLGLIDDGQLKSVISLFQENQSMQFRKFATLESEQGKGYGSNLLKHVFEQCNQSDIQLIWCHARVSKAKFYEKFGMKKVGEAFLKNGIEYVKMEKSMS